MMTTSTTRLLLIRHGETEWNTLKRYQGQHDSPLTAKGRAQAGRIAERLADVRFTHLLSSDLGRARATAECIAAAHPGVPVETDSRLRERHFGILTGMTRAEAAAAHPHEEARYLSGDPDYRIPDGESLRDVAERAALALEAWAVRWEGETFVAVTHGGVCGQFLRHVLGIPLTAARAYKFVNCALNVFTRECSEGREPRWFLHTWGDVEHLHGIGAEDDL